MPKTANARSFSSALPNKRHKSNLMDATTHSNHQTYLRHIDALKTQFNETVVKGFYFDPTIGDKGGVICAYCSKTNNGSFTIKRPHTNNQRHSMRGHILSLKHYNRVPIESQQSYPIYQRLLSKTKTVQNRASNSSMHQKCEQIPSVPFNANKEANTNSLSFCEYFCQQTKITMNRKLTMQQINDLYQGINYLNAKHLDTILTLISEYIPESNVDEEFELDIQTLPNTIQIKMYNYILQSVKYQETKKKLQSMSVVSNSQKKLKLDSQCTSDTNMACISSNNVLKGQLLEMGYNQYTVEQSLQNIHISTDSGDNELLFAAINWIDEHPISEQELQNENIERLCAIIQCERYQALYALQRSDHNIQNALDMLVQAQLNTVIDSNDESDTNSLSKLSQPEIQNLQLQDSILSATVLSIHEERKKEQQWHAMKGSVVSELRSMGFLQIAATKAVNDKSVSDKKSAIRYILSHPMNSEQEKLAKIEEICKCGYTQNEALSSLDKFAQNLDISLSWLMQGKPSKVQHFLYHIDTKNVLQTVHNESVPLLSKDIDLKSEEQQWSFYDNGKIKNFEHNKILVIKYNKSNDESSLCLIADFDDDANENHSNEQKEALEYLKFWEIDETEKTIRSKEKKLYLVFRKDSQKFTLEQTIHNGDMSQRWCFVDANGLTKLNPKELAQLLDCTDFECVVCWDNEPNVRLEPCGHSTFCEACIENLKPKECMICRTKIHSSRKFE